MHTPKRSHSPALRCAVLILVMFSIASTLRAAESFSTPINISSDPADSAYPQIAVDQNGNVNLIWISGSWGSREIFFSRSNDGGATFSSPINLSSNAGDSYISGGTSPQIAVDSQGNINVVWVDATPSNPEVFFTRSTDGGLTFSTPMNLSNNDGESQSPSVAVSSTGNIYVAWDEYWSSSGHSDIFFAGSTDGGETFATQNLTESPDVNALWPHMVIDGKDNIHLLYAAGLGMTYRRSDDGGYSFSSPVEIPSVEIIYYRAVLAVNDAGIICVTWRDFSVDIHRPEIFFTRSTDGGLSFETPINVSNTPESSPFPQMAVYGTKDVYIFWEDFGQDHSQVMFSVSKDGGATFAGPWLPPSPATDYGLARIAVDPKGALDVLWHVNSDVYFSSSTNGGASFSAPQNISQTSGPEAGSAAMAADTKGNKFFVWNENVSGSYDIFFSGSMKAQIKEGKKPKP